MGLLPRECTALPRCMVDVFSLPNACRSPPANRTPSNPHQMKAIRTELGGKLGCSELISEKPGRTMVKLVRPAPLRRVGRERRGAGAAGHIIAAVR